MHSWSWEAFKMVSMVQPYKLWYNFVLQAIWRRKNVRQIVNHKHYSRFARLLNFDFEFIHVSQPFSELHNERVVILMKHSKTRQKGLHIQLPSEVIIALGDF